jgi:hypothetical protein
MTVQGNKTKVLTKRLVCSRLAAITPTMTTILAMTALLTTPQAATTINLLTIIRHPGTTTETDTTDIPDTIGATTAATMTAIRADTTAVAIEVGTGRASCTGEPHKGTCKC